MVEPETADPFDYTSLPHENHVDPVIIEEENQPTYDEAFPALQSSNVPVEQLKPAGKWNTKPVLRTTSITQVFKVPAEERRFKASSEFGSSDKQQLDICKDVSQETGAQIEFSEAKDESLTVMITGKPAAVAFARRLVVAKLQTQASVELDIPRDHHRFILGKGGQRLQQLELQTSTKITLPRNGSTIIRIVGSREGIDRARHEIQLISDEQAKLAFERLIIEHVYHPFLAGSVAAGIVEKTGARINIPPGSAMKNEITVAGEKEGVAKAVSEIKEIYDEKKRKTTTVSIEVRKSQHKYIIGPKGGTIHEILDITGVSVEVPPTEKDTETITLRGEPDKLGAALTLVYEKANKVVIAEVEAPHWLHRFIIGRKGQNIRKITQDLPKVHVEFSSAKDSITLEGPPQEVDRAREALETFTKELKANMDFAEISVDQKYYPHIIGKNGSNVTRIKELTGTSILIPTNPADNTRTIRIEGSPQGVAEAKREIVEMVSKMENERSRDIIIEQRFHRNIIVEKLPELREKFAETQISFPDPSKKTDVVNIRGPKEQSDKVYTFLKKYNTELIAANYCLEVPIFKQFHKNVIGRGGATIRKIREESDTKIELPSEGSDSDVIIITGYKEKVEMAKEKILAIQNELINITQSEVIIPSKHHNALIGAKGKLIRSIMDECGGVSIKFPPEGGNSDKVVIRGPKDDVDKARKMLLTLHSERELNSFTDEVRAKPQHHKFLIGRKGENIRKVRDKTGARIVFPTSKDDDQELITIIGTKEGVQTAKKQLMEEIKNLDNIAEGEVNVDPKHHRHFVQRRGQVLQEISDQYGGVTISFPRNGANSSRVVLKGAKDCVEGAKARILEIVEELEQMVSIECVIAQKHHRAIMGAKGANVQNICQSMNVQIKFPEREQTDENAANTSGENEGMVNGSAPSSPDTEEAPKKCDIILIHGRSDHAQAAKDALMELVPITETLMIPFDYHRFIIGAKGTNVRQMMDKYDVSIAIPPAQEESEAVTVTGAKAKVEKAKEALKERVAEIEADNEDRALRQFQLTMSVPSIHHPKIIGRKGLVIQRIRTEHQVNIQFPPVNAPEGENDMITITGYESNCEAAKKDIQQIVDDLEGQITKELRIDPRVHRRLIGARGKAIRVVMDKFRVDIRFPRNDNSDTVTITGLEDNVEDASDHLLDLEEEYMQDIRDEVEEHDLINHYMNPPSKQSGQKPGFVVRDAPWSKPANPTEKKKVPSTTTQEKNTPPPDTNDTEDFPYISAATASLKKPHGHVPWGPSRH